MSDVQKPSGGISRRSVAKGMAWSVPAVAVASAAPAFAASGGGPTIQFISACKSPGNSCKTFPKGYQFFYKICNPTDLDIYIYNITATGGDLIGTATITPSTPILVPSTNPDTCVDVSFTNDSTNSANQSFTAHISFEWGHNPTPPDPKNHPPVTDDVLIPKTPPDCLCPAG